jgi:hypothetical protein
MVFVDKNAPPGDGKVGFWYENTTQLNSVQSAYQWLYTRAFGGGSPGIPTIDDDTTARLENFSKIVLMAEDASLLDTGYKSLARFAEQHNESLKLLAEEKFDGRALDFSYRMFERVSLPLPDPIPNDSTVAFLDLSTITTPEPSPAQVDLENGIARISTVPQPGAFSAFLEIPEAARTSGPGAIRLWLHVTKGEIYLFAASPDDTNRRLHRDVRLAASGKEILVVVPLSNLVEPTTVVLGNGSANASSIVLIRAVEIVRGDFAIPV